MKCKCCLTVSLHAIGLYFLTVTMPPGKDGVLVLHPPVSSLNNTAGAEITLIKEKPFIDFSIF